MCVCVCACGVVDSYRAIRQRRTRPASQSLPPRASQFFEVVALLPQVLCPFPSVQTPGEPTATWWCELVNPSVCMHLLGVLCAAVAWSCVTLVAAAPPAASAPAHHLQRRSFFNLQCKGVYDVSIFAKLDRICNDCYMLFREAELYTLCRNDCFTTNYFKGCVEVLQETDRLDLFKQYIKQLHGADPGV